MILIIINFYNGSGKPRKFSKSRLTKWTALLVLSNFETIVIFYEFLDDKLPVTLGTRFLQKS